MPDDDRVDLPVDPESGLTGTAVAALHSYAFGPADPDERYQRLIVLRTWLDWCLERDVTAESLRDVVVVQRDDGSLAVRTGRSRTSAEPLETLTAAFQRSLLEAAGPAGAEQIVVALECVDELVSDLIGVHVDEETLFGHLALRHRIPADPGEGYDAWLDRHRAAHRAGERYVGHGRDRVPDTSSGS